MYEAFKNSSIEFSPMLNAKTVTWASRPCRISFVIGGTLACPKDYALPFL
jgi:hypothetical protein